ncbi:glycosyltransferase family 2 protein [Butyrivibrio sp. YAB3001]|uniref:glycosyltransferase family 2 protein n=1 Tax=Butyrivibrio sp. YAB3001 TaxID=1520812 RepID=UPI0008F647A8|nr:glycosyltransferase family 2 protein [Butyrivibrio sp. YAB3001]SFB94083.1 Nucleotidyl transferase [Butyrivibrio sp. YAB3001]
MNALILFSGDDKAFKEGGYLYPKNLTEIDGTPMIENVLNGFKDIISASDKLLLTMRKTEIDKYYTASVARLLYPECKIVSIPNITKGAACAVLLAVQDIDNDEELVVMNGDIIIEQPLMPAIEDFRKRNLDGGAITIESVHPRWSFVKCDENGHMIEAAEKRPISKNATVGIYYYKHGKEYVEAAKNMIRKDASVNGIFYICPVFNEMILSQKKLGIHQIDRNNYYSLANPAGVEAYNKHLEERA